MEIRRPWSSSSETVSAVSALQVAEHRGLADKFGLGLLLANVRFAPEAADREFPLSQIQIASGQDLHPREMTSTLSRAEIISRPDIQSVS